ncbi:hypothetical protein M9H77_13224 [Catharanthus roseus]|uniref:Uncharacterized protein n=1 Tax=Catharanthus roseus TaxID=4058 RepID=A0ACC0BJH4_CATRO|nr:hypothetical protein M9H77_13224 [Catharanthus roseus]
MLPCCNLCLYIYIYISPICLTLIILLLYRLLFLKHTYLGRVICIPGQPLALEVCLDWSRASREAETHLTKDILRVGQNPTADGRSTLLSAVGRLTLSSIGGRSLPKIVGSTLSLVVGPLVMANVENSSPGARKGCCAPRRMKMEMKTGENGAKTMKTEPSAKRQPTYRARFLDSRTEDIISRLRSSTWRFKRRDWKTLGTSIAASIFNPKLSFPLHINRKVSELKKEEQSRATNWGLSWGEKRFSSKASWTLEWMDLTNSTSSFHPSSRHEYCKKRSRTEQQAHSSRKATFQRTTVKRMLQRIHGDANSFIFFDNLVPETLTNWGGIRGHKALKKQYKASMRRLLSFVFGSSSGKRGCGMIRDKYKNVEIFQVPITRLMARKIEGKDKGMVALFEKNL